MKSTASVPLTSSDGTVQPSMEATTAGKSGRFEGTEGSSRR